MLVKRAFAASIHDTSHEGKSIVDLAEEKKYIPPLMDKIITAQQIDFSAETKFSGIEFIADKRRTILSKEQEEVMASFSNSIEDDDVKKDNAKNSSASIGNNRVHRMLLELERNNGEVKILKGAVDTMLKIGGRTCQ